MKRRRSIPASAKERTVSPFRRVGDELRGGIWFHEVECRVNGKVVGTRSYDDKDRLIFETPMRNGKWHGMRLQWDEEGYLELAEPYRNGKIEGTTRQYHRGRLIGTYTIRNGFGLDVWRNQRNNGKWYVSEIRCVRGGQWDGIECWFNEDQHSVWREAHWRKGRLHGVEREWTGKRLLAKRYPRYWMNGERISKRTYMAACKRESTLPPFRERDQKPMRSLASALSLAESADAVDAAALPVKQRKELNRRVKAHRERKSKGESAGSSWPQVKRRIRAR